MPKKNRTKMTNVWENLPSKILPQTVPPPQKNAAKRARVAPFANLTPSMLRGALKSSEIMHTQRIESKAHIMNLAVTFSLITSAPRVTVIMGCIFCKITTIAGLIYLKAAEKHIRPIAEAPKPTRINKRVSFGLIFENSLLLLKAIGVNTIKLIRCSQKIRTSKGTAARAGFLKKRSVLRNIPQAATIRIAALLFIYIFAFG